MANITDYNGNHLEFPEHSHEVSDTVGERVVGKLDPTNLMSDFSFGNYIYGYLKGGSIDELINETVTAKTFYLSTVPGTMTAEFSMKLDDLSISNKNKYIFFIESINDDNVLTFINIENIKFSTSYPYNGTDDVTFTVKKVNNIDINKGNVYEVTFSGTNIPRSMYVPIKIHPVDTSVPNIKFATATFRKVDYVTEETNIAIVSDTDDGFMTPIDKIELEDTYKQSVAMLNRLENIIYVSDPSIPVQLVDGPTFNTVIKKVGPTASMLKFTNTAIPEEKLSSAILVSSDISDKRIYAYLDGATIVIAPSQDASTFKLNHISTGMFYGCNKLKTITFSNINSDELVNCSEMFRDCSSLETINSFNFNMNEVTDASYMFHGCSKLTNIDLGTWNTDNLKNTKNMFYNCTNLNGYMTINGIIENYENMFTGCSTLSGTEFNLKYTNEDTKIIAEEMAKTKSTNSNIIVSALPI